MAEKTRAEQIAGAIRANASAFHERRATYEAFDLRARALWARAEAMCVEEDVLALVYPPLGGHGDRR